MMILKTKIVMLFKKINLLQMRYILFFLSTLFINLICILHAQMSMRHDCIGCSKSFANAYLLEIHYKIHEQQQEEEVQQPIDNPQIEESENVNTQQHCFYKCDKCDRSFKSVSSFQYHKESEHNSGRRFACSKCGKHFKHKQLLQRHQLVHTEDRPYSCETCGASFKTKPNLLNHLSKHQGVIKNHECKMCPQTFSRKSSLKLHYIWHSGTKPFKCDVSMANLTKF